MTLDGGSEIPHTQPPVPIRPAASSTPGVRPSLTPPNPALGLHEQSTDQSLRAPEAGGIVDEAATALAAQRVAQEREDQQRELIVIQSTGDPITTDTAEPGLVALRDSGDGAHKQQDDLASTAAGRQDETLTRDHEVLPADPTREDPDAQDDTQVSAALSAQSIPVLSGTTTNESARHDGQETDAQVQPERQPLDVQSGPNNGDDGRSGGVLGTPTASADSPEAGGNTPPRAPEQTPAVTTNSPDIPASPATSSLDRPAVAATQPTDQTGAEAPDVAKTYQEAAKITIEAAQAKIEQAREQQTPIDPGDKDKILVDQYEAARVAALPQADRDTLAHDIAELDKKISEGKNAAKAGEESVYVKQLEQRRARLESIVTAADEQARATLAGNLPEGQGLDAEKMQAEAAVKVAYGQEYRNVERPREAELDRLAQAADKARKEKNFNMAKVSMAEMDVLQQTTDQEAIHALINKANGEQDPKKKAALDIQIRAMTKTKDMAEASALVASTLARLQETYKLLTDPQRRKELEKAAAIADYGVEKKLDNEAQFVLDGELKRLYDMIDIDAQIAVFKGAGVEVPEGLKLKWSELDNLGKSDAYREKYKKVQKLAKHNYKAVAKNRRQAIMDLRKALKDPNTAPADLKKLRDDLKAANSAYRKEAFYTGGRLYGIFLLALLYLTVYFSIKGLQEVFPAK